MKPNITVSVANESHISYVDTILETIESAAKKRGTGIARRSPDYVKDKMREGKAIIALDGDKFAGFCYIETWSNRNFVANSGLIVDEAYRGIGLATRIKLRAIELCFERFPSSKIFSLTTGAKVMKMNSDLGFKPVTFADLTDDDAFWKGCQTCVNYDVLTRTNRKMCLCTGLLYDPTDPANAHNQEILKERFKINHQNEK
ncbi:MAG: GNAT family N-acetyltransferase [Paludibacteraceae bacterium]|jgi:GNAT superfamily N-acetyltransferase|nr:GNAT family N-acetyltransferase [Paludibacteraceae bacterium]